MLEQVLHEIRRADAKEIDELLDAVLERRRQLYPDWEMFYMAAPKQNPENGEQVWKNMWKQLTG